eukprot:3061874-Amphidinium_carterae.1
MKRREEMKESFFGHPGRRGWWSPISECSFCLDGHPFRPFTLLCRVFHLKLWHRWTRPVPSLVNSQNHPPQSGTGSTELTRAFVCVGAVAVVLIRGHTAQGFNNCLTVRAIGILRNSHTKELCPESLSDRQSLRIANPRLSSIVDVLSSQASHMRQKERAGTLNPLPCPPREIQDYITVMQPWSSRGEHGKAFRPFPI